MALLWDDETRIEAKPREYVVSDLCYRCGRRRWPKMAREIQLNPSKMARFFFGDFNEGDIVEPWLGYAYTKHDWNRDRSRAVFVLMPFNVLFAALEIISTFMRVPFRQLVRWVRKQKKEYR